MSIIYAIFTALGKFFKEILPELFTELRKPAEVEPIGYDEGVDAELRKNISEDADAMDDEYEDLEEFDLSYLSGQHMKGDQ